MSAKQVIEYSGLAFGETLRLMQALQDLEDDDNKELTYYSNHQEVDPNEWCGEYKSKPNYYKNVRILNK